MKKILILLITLLILGVKAENTNAAVVACGLNIDPANAKGYPATVSIAGNQWVRIEFKDCTTDDPISNISLDTYRAVLQRYKSAGMRTLVIIDYLTYPNAATNVDKFAKRVEQINTNLGSLIDAYEIWNEQDHPRHFPLSAADYAALLKAVAPKVGGNSKAIVGGLASGDPSYLTAVKTALGTTTLDSLVQAVGIHPYDKKVNGYPPPNDPAKELKTMLAAYRSINPTLPLWITEMGLDTPDENQQKEYIGKFYTELRTLDYVPVAIWFAFSDGMVNPFGIVNASNGKKASFGTYFTSACGVAEPGAISQEGAISPAGGQGCGGGPSNPGTQVNAGYIHPGIDIKPQRGNASASYIYSTHAGFVTYAGPAPAGLKERGWMVQIESDLSRDNIPDVVTRYVHLVPNSLMINDVRYKRYSFTADFFAGLLYRLEPVQKLPYGYGPYVARNQMLGLVGDSGSPGHRHIQYEIMTNRYNSLYAATLDTFVPYACLDDPYIQACATDRGRPGFFFANNEKKPNRVMGPLYMNGGFITPAPALTPIIVTPVAPAPTTPPVGPTSPPTTPQPTTVPPTAWPRPPVPANCAWHDCFTMCVTLDCSGSVHAIFDWHVGNSACFCGDLSDNEVLVNGVSQGRSCPRVISDAVSHQDCEFHVAAGSTSVNVCRQKGNYIPKPGWDDACRAQNDWGICATATTSCQ